MSQARYTETAIYLHWLIAFLLIGLFAVGLYMNDLPLSPWKLQIYSWHKWAGVTVFLLVLIRIFWRLAHSPPVLSGDRHAPMRMAAQAGHRLLYLLMVAIPVSGWLMSSAKGFQTVYFGVLPLPNLLDNNKELGELLQSIHQILNFVLAVLATGHVGVALKHQLSGKNDALLLMLPRFFR